MTLLDRVFRHICLHLSVSVRSLKITGYPLRSCVMAYHTFQVKCSQYNYCKHIVRKMAQKGRRLIGDRKS